MPFPPTPRVRYGKNPLVEVVCQLKFPTILRIDAEAPAAFQERIRAAFPEYVPARRAQLPAGLQLPPDILQMVFGNASTGSHEFVTEDEQSRVSLTRDFVALTTSAYNDWATFWAMMKTPLDALTEVYKPSYFSRVGLRYRDQIDRKVLGLESVPWSELLTSEVAGELAHPEVAPDITRIVRELAIKIPDGSGNIRVVHGLEGDAPDATYMIDVDLFTERKVPVGETSNVLHGFNQGAGNLFRWCIKPRLQAAMEPREP